jgi:predicted O-linked N-acetylglucosamine transferase (SPINDLY family)
LLRSQQFFENFQKLIIPHRAKLRRRLISCYTFAVPKPSKIKPRRSQKAIGGELLPIAIQHHQAGRLADAERAYQAVLQQQPDSAEARHLLGVLHNQTHRSEAAIELIRRAIWLAPAMPEFHASLASALLRSGRVDEAIVTARKAVDLNPSFPTAHFNLAVMLEQAGRLDEAAGAYRRAIDLKSDYFEAHNNLATVLKSLGRMDDAVIAFRAAAALRPDLAVLHNNLGAALREQGFADESIAACNIALRLQPDFIEARNNIGSALLDQANPAEALAEHQRALRLNPRNAETHNCIGNALQKLAKPDEAIAAYRQALHLNPRFVEAYNNLGNALKDQGKLAEAVNIYKSGLVIVSESGASAVSRGQSPIIQLNMSSALAAMGQLELAADACLAAIALKPDCAKAHNALGNVRMNQNRRDDAVAAYQNALAIDPEYVDALSNLGRMLYHQGKLDEAVAVLQSGLDKNNNYALIHNNLAITCKERGELDRSIASFKRALQLKPDDATIHSNLLFGAHFHPDYDAKTLLAKHRDWDRRHGVPLRRFIQPHRNDRSPDRRLRIGYVSPDLRQHSVARFFLPLLENHDPSAVEVFCYADVLVQDAMTAQLKKHAHFWRNILGFRDDRVAELIRDDQIDILVDLAMHSGNNRLLVFARKPAPVQVSYLAYASTTGLSAIDYRLTDSYLDPPGQGDEFYSEESIRLPENYWCYQPHPSMKEVQPLPAIKNGFITFGCLNNFGKVTEPALRIWSGILRAIPNSRLLLHAKEGSHRQRVIDLLEKEGIAPDRLSFIGHLAEADFFQLYHRIDIALDPFPFAGGTTTCDALWMGVPVITLAGQTAVGRAGVSILSNAGLQNLIATSSEHYQHIAIQLAGDLDHLANLRAGLRDQVRASPLVNAERFAKNVEAVYRMIWRRWCEKDSQESKA